MSSQLSSDRHSLTAHGMKVDPIVCPLTRKIATKLNNKPTLQQLMSLLENSMICPGHPDKQFIEMIKAKKKVNFCQGMARQWQEWMIMLL